MGVEPLVEGGVGSTSLSFGTCQGNDNFEGSILSSLSASENAGESERSWNRFGSTVTICGTCSRSMSASALALVVFTWSPDLLRNSSGVKKAP